MSTQQPQLVVSTSESPSAKRSEDCPHTAKKKRQKKKNQKNAESGEARPNNVDKQDVAASVSAAPPGAQPSGANAQTKQNPKEGKSKAAWKEMSENNQAAAEAQQRVEQERIAAEKRAQADRDRVAAAEKRARVAAEQQRRAEAKREQERVAAEERAQAARAEQERSVTEKRERLAAEKRAEAKRKSSKLFQLFSTHESETEPALSEGPDSEPAMADITSVFQLARKNMEQSMASDRDRAREHQAQAKLHGHPWPEGCDEELDARQDARNPTKRKAARVQPLEEHERLYATLHIIIAYYITTRMLEGAGR
jgi:hypothetical protein